MSQEADGKLQPETMRGSNWRPDLKLVLQARWQRAEAIDCVQLWCTWQLIGVQWWIQWVLRSGGVRWQADSVEVERLISGLPLMDRLGRTVHKAHSGQFSTGGGQFTWRVNIPWCMAERLAATGLSDRESEAMT
jgi:hypothetical protein